MTKKEARAFAKAKLPSLVLDSQRVHSILQELDKFHKQSKTPVLRVASYSPDSFEIDPLPLLQTWNVEIFYPRIVKDHLEFVRPIDWKKGKFGIPEPVGSMSFAWSDMDLILVPSLGINAEGARLGRGGGYYDKTLSILPQAKESKSTSSAKIPVLMGLGFDELFPLPFSSESHDQRLNVWFVENKSYSF